MWAIIFVGQICFVRELKKIVNKGKEIFDLNQASLYFISINIVANYSYRHPHCIPTDVQG